jgi:hypothetical protein
MPCPYPVRTHRSVCTSGLAHRRGHGPTARCRRHNTTGAGLGPAPTWTSTIRHSPFTIRHSLFAIRRLFPFAIRDSLFAVFFTARRSLLAARGLSPSATRNSQLATRHSPLAVFHHSPVAIRHSLYFPFAILGGRSLVPPPHAECSARFGARLDRCAALRAMLPFAALCG